MVFYSKRHFNAAGEFCDWHYLAAVDEADARQYVGEHDRLDDCDAATFRASYNPRGYRWPNSIRHVYTPAALKEIAKAGDRLGPLERL